jgi:hypothetical protein
LLKQQLQQGSCNITVPQKYNNCHNQSQGNRRQLRQRNKDQTPTQIRVSGAQ